MMNIDNSDVNQSLKDENFGSTKWDTAVLNIKKYNNFKTKNQTFDKVKEKENNIYNKIYIREHEANIKKPSLKFNIVENDKIESSPFEINNVSYNHELKNVDDLDDANIDSESGNESNLSDKTLLPDGGRGHFCFNDSSKLGISMWLILYYIMILCIGIYMSIFCGDIYIKK
ncbi:uncharacterized protein VNE69_03096 [Vairimorpha necatrix]|uniref:Membrane protein n=1 Tax=Vairimorpha necatrix TaxID=6039 RepID=A0AAX4JAA7_9MICR